MFLPILLGVAMTETIVGAVGGSALTGGGIYAYLAYKKSEHAKAQVLEARRIAEEKERFDREVERRVELAFRDREKHTPHQRNG